MKHISTNKRNKLIISTIVSIAIIIFTPKFLLWVFGNHIITVIAIIISYLILLSEIIDNVQVLLGKPIISIEGDYLIIRRLFRNKKMLISEISFKFMDIGFSEYLYLKNGSKKAMIKYYHVPDDLETQLR